MWKYGVNHNNELAATDFLFDSVYIMGSISTPNGILYPGLLPLAHYKGVRVSVFSANFQSPTYEVRISTGCEICLVRTKGTIFAHLTQVFPYYTAIQKRRVTVNDRARQIARFQTTSRIF